LWEGFVKKYGGTFEKVFVLICEDKHENIAPWRLWAHSWTISLLWNSEKSKFVFDRKSQLCERNGTERPYYLSLRKRNACGNRNNGGKSIA
jgi:hypothetical protein